MKSNFFNTRDNLDPRWMEGVLEGANSSTSASLNGSTRLRRRLEYEFGKRLDAYTDIQTQAGQDVHSDSEAVYAFRLLQHARLILEQAEQLLCIEPRRMYQFRTIESQATQSSLTAFADSVVTMAISVVSNPGKLPLIPDIVAELCYEVHQQSIYLYGREPSTNVEWVRFLMLTTYYIELKQLRQLITLEGIKEEVYHVNADDDDESIDDSEVARRSL